MNQSFIDSIQAKGFVKAIDGSWYKPPTKAEVKILEAKQGPKKRIRQNPKPLLNKLESDWFQVLKSRNMDCVIRPQAKRFNLACGAWYKPDFTAIVNGKETAWECKGPKQAKNVARGILTLKFAARQWPEVKFIMVWKDGGFWHEQEIIP